MTKSAVAAVTAFLMIVMIALACGGEAGEAPEEDDMSRVEKAAPEESSTEAEVDSIETEPEGPPEEREVPEPTAAGPERIRFKRGMSEDTIKVELLPNETKKYVVGVGPAQYFHIGMEDFRPVISISNTSRLSEIEEGDNYFSAVTTRSGDIVFEFSNPTRNSLKTFAIVTIKDREPLDH